MKTFSPPLHVPMSFSAAHNCAARCFRFILAMVFPILLANQLQGQYSIENSLSSQDISVRIFAGPSTCTGSGTYTLVNCQTVLAGITDPISVSLPPGDVIRRVWVFCGLSCGTQVGSLSCTGLSSNFTCGGTTYTIEGDFVNYYFRIY